MAARNDVTNDLLISRKLSKEGEENFDLIFGKKKTNGGWKPPMDAYDLENRLNRIAEGEDEA